MAIQVKWFVLGTFLILFSSCYYDKEEILYPRERDCGGITRKFSTEVLPVMQTKCSFASDCHGTGSTNSGGLLTNYDNIKNKAILVRHQVLIGAMPKGGSLTATELNTIVCWIDSGSPNN